MAEYIERDEAIRKTLEACVMVVGHGISQIDAVDIVDVMESIPTADVVPVVRCKDCKFYNNGSCVVYLQITTRVKPNDYCSYGERRCEE